MIDRFQLGFANRTLGYRLPEKNRLAGAELRGRLQNLGIFRESGHEHFNGSVVIPIFDLAVKWSRCTGGRSRRATSCGMKHRSTCICRGRIGRVERRGAGCFEGNHLVRGAHRRTDVLVRGLSPCDHELRHQRLHRRAPGCVPKVRHEENLHRLRPRQRRRGRGAGTCRETLAMGIECFRVQFPKNMDANEYALKVQPSAKSLGCS